jgi:hypothetical protein
VTTTARVDRLRLHAPDEPSPARRSILSPAGTAMAAAGYLATVAAIDPFRAYAVGCPVHAVTGGWCPGCGSTRAVHQLLEGDVVGSLVCHPLVVPIAGLLAYLWVGWAVRTHGPGPAARWLRRPAELPAWIPMAVAVAFVALTTVRNVPGVEWLVPPDAAP